MNRNWKRGTRRTLTALAIAALVAGCAGGYLGVGGGTGGVSAGVGVGTGGTSIGVGATRGNVGVGIGTGFGGYGGYGPWGGCYVLPDGTYAATCP